MREMCPLGISEAYGHQRHATRMLRLERCLCIRNLDHDHHRVCHCPSSKQRFRSLQLVWKGRGPTKYKDYGQAGLYITTIDGDDGPWIYRVNDVLVGIAASKCMVKDNYYIKWIALS